MGGPPLLEALTNKLAGDRCLLGNDYHKLLTCAEINSVAIGAAQIAKFPVAEVQVRTPAVVLAAGGSSRFDSSN